MPMLGGRVSLVDEDGMLLEKPDSGTFDFPVLYWAGEPCQASTIAARVYHSTWSSCGNWGWKPPAPDG